MHISALCGMQCQSAFMQHNTVHPTELRLLHVWHDWCLYAHFMLTGKHDIETAYFWSVLLLLYITCLLLLDFCGDIAVFMPFPYFVFVVHMMEPRKSRSSQPFAAVANCCGMQQQRRVRL